MYRFRTRSTKELKKLNPPKDYLTKEGYPRAAAKFSREANITPYQDNELIRARHSIIHSIHSGDVKSAINTINELDPESGVSCTTHIVHKTMMRKKPPKLNEKVLDRNPSLHFDLLRLQLVELIRNCNSNPGSDITPALNFAAEELAPRAPSNDSFMEDLEKTMTLLVFPSDKLEPDLACLLEPSLRRKVAEKVNKAILARQNSQREATIRKLIRLRAWAEESARSKNIDLPFQIKVDVLGKTTEEKI
ncbi:Glucose-induced degradation protein 8-like protein [Erysiphe neolycopersici]|uniref:Glucose-induced degradation protein 8-like protein n=1 Tax=Erysiphe neolycopersici TaxID=212602 RepID=A0A420H8Y6_9PEZI|nr:Glucose-induced degradation protein 8-like protein [Erysiphe neolycopersici]